jgi:Ca-activated chloride channel family protein
MAHIIGLFSLTSLALAAEPTALPLKDQQVSVLITGPYAELTVTQTFQNLNEEYIEAVYTFPLHEQAAVDEMRFQVGDRIIEGEIMEKGEAREVYEEAKAQGQSAALTEQDRPNVFSQSIANLAPGQEVVVTLHMVQPLTYLDGAWTFEHPLTIGPRFTPAGSISSGDAAAISPPIDDTDTTVDFDVVVEMGVEIGRLELLSHPEKSVRTRGGGAHFTIQDMRPSRDFVLSIQPMGLEPVSSLLVQDDHFALTLEPQVTPSDDQIVPRELIFVVDNSCSMSGQPMDMAKDAMRTALQGMLPGDSFQVIRFSEEASALSSRPLLATPENIQKGMAYVDGMQGMGGTHMLAGIEASLDYPQDPERQRIVCFMTDGYIGNEQQIIGAITNKLGPTRLFSMGIGSSVNRYLLDEMSEAGGGTVSYVLPTQEPADSVKAFYSTIARPVLTEVTVDFGEDVRVYGRYPQRLPDLYVGHPLQIVGRFDGNMGPITVRGKMGNKLYEEVLDIVAVDDGSAIASAWARQKVTSLEREQLYGEIDVVQAEILDVALNYRLLTQYTSFVAVEYRVRNEGGKQTRVHQPSESPDGVDLDAAMGGDLSRRYMPPGDPLLTVYAPENADEVVVVFPWGGIESLAWDADRGRWFVRFLVPRDVEDGLYEVRVFVMLPDGSTEIRTEELVIDAAAPELDVHAELRGGVTVLTFVPQEPLRSVLVEPIGLPGVAQRVDLRQHPGGLVTVVLAGEYAELRIVAKDRAMNRVEQTILVSQ